MTNVSANLCRYAQERTFRLAENSCQSSLLFRAALVGSNRSCWHLTRLSFICNHSSYHRSHRERSRYFSSLPCRVDFGLYSRPLLSFNMVAVSKAPSSFSLIATLTTQLSATAAWSPMRCCLHPTSPLLLPGTRPPTNCCALAGAGNNSFVLEKVKINHISYKYTQTLVNWHRGNKPELRKPGCNLIVFKFACFRHLSRLFLLVASCYSSQAEH